MTAPTKEDLQVHWEEDGTATCLNGKYRIWKDLLGRWRWALKRWPDNGFGTSNHGRAHSPTDAAVRCWRHQQRLTELEDWIG